jgi:uncharacterized membrane protein
MGGFESRVVIDRPVEEVAAFLSDLLNDPRWRREWLAARPASEGQPLGVGSATVLTGQVLGRRTEAVYEVTRHEPGRLTQWRTVSGPLPLTFARAFEPVPGGGTRVTFSYEAEPSAALRLLEPFVISLGRRALDGDLPALRRVLRG